MQNPPKHSIFRIFSANDWNQSEIYSFQFHLFFFNLTFKNASTFFSNAEKLRKTASHDTRNSRLELTRTSWSIGLRMRPIQAMSQHLTVADTRAG